MKIAHVAAHLGGGIGKAHASLARALPRGVEQLFLLHQNPVDQRHVADLKHCGHTVSVFPLMQDLIPAAMRWEPDILQFEYWGHCSDVWFALPNVKTVVWCHRSGIGETRLPDHTLLDHLVMTSPISKQFNLRHKYSVINSGFGFDEEFVDRGNGVCYLGTVDFKKMHPDFFTTIDELRTRDPVIVWGDPSPEVEYAARSMRRPSRVSLRGHTDDPRWALSGSGIFFYPLRRDHYGTAENALVEAMSMGLVPVVLDNQAESHIVPSEAGFVCKNLDECLAWIEVLVRRTDLRLKMAERAHEHAKSFSAAKSAAQFVKLWSSLKQPTFLEGYFTDRVNAGDRIDPNTGEVISA